MYEITFVYAPKQTPMLKRQMECIPRVGDVICLDGKHFGKHFVTLRVEEVIHNVIRNHEVFIMLTNGYVRMDFLKPKSAR